MPVFTKRLQQSLRVQLLDESREMMTNAEVGSLGEILKKNFPSITRPLLLNCIAEQGEDIYWLLVSAKEIAVIEIPRKKTDTPGSILEMIEVDSYRSKRLSRDPRQRLAIALELISQ